MAESASEVVNALLERAQGGMNKRKSGMEDANPTQRVVDVVDVVRHGDKLILPEGLGFDGAIDVLKRRKAYEEEDVEVDGPVPGFVFDAAHAFYRVLQDKFGWVNAVATPTMFGPRPPRLMSVPIGRNEVVQVPWGRMVLPGIEGNLSTEVRFNASRHYEFRISGVVKRKHEGAVLEIVEATKRYLRDHSVYQGKAFRLRLFDSDGDPMPLPEPHFLELNDALERQLVMNPDVAEAISDSIFTVIEHTDAVRTAGIPLKRGVLLSGEYGTGKSMTSTVTASKAVRNGWTFVLVERANELSDALRIAREWGPAVVFCEDIDRVSDGERDLDMDELLNVIDGVESKSAELLIVLTTNHVENIHPALLRPGRLDAVIPVSAPDATSVERLMRQYAGSMIASDEDLTEPANLMAGSIPAVVREVVERSKLSAVRRSPGAPLAITASDLVSASRSMRAQMELLRPKPADKRSDVEKAAATLADAMAGGNGFSMLTPSGANHRD